MKKFITGLVFGLVLAMSFSVMANSKIVAEYFSPNIVIDGQKQSLKTKPVLINGSTYLPMRELAETLDYNVQYEASSKTIKLTDNGGSTNENVNKPPANNTQPKQEDSNEFMTLSELENLGFKFTFNNGLLIENTNGMSFQLSKNGYDKLVNDGSVSILKNNVVFWLNYKDGNIVIENKILEAFK